MKKSMVVLHIVIEPSTNLGPCGGTRRQLSVREATAPARHSEGNGSPPSWTRAPTQHVRKAPPRWAALRQRADARETMPVRTLRSVGSSSSVAQFGVEREPSAHVGAYKPDVRHGRRSHLRSPRNRRCGPSSCASVHNTPCRPGTGAPDAAAN